LKSFFAATSLVALVLGLLAPLGAGAQQTGQMRRLGVLMGIPEGDPRGEARLTAFRKGLQTLGWEEGRNLRLDIRWATTSDAPATQKLARELIELHPDVLLSHNTPTTAALLQHTHTIPVVFAVVSDPIGSGFVTSVSRPGGNATGFTNIEPTMAGKWPELLKEIAPRVTRVAFLFNPATAPYAEHYLSSFKRAATSLAVEAMATPVHNTSELELIIAAQARTPNSGLVVMTDAFLIAHRAQIAALAARYRLPAVYPFRDFIEAGGLLSYGNDPRESFHRAAAYADRLLKGAAPSELPVQAPVKFELVLNVKVAKALGLTIPRALLLRADQVIE